jgi:hemerythrin
MALIEWSEDLSVNIAEIDRQHQKLITMINELHDAMKERRTDEVLGKIIDSLVNYTETHFAFEEGYFEEFNYPATKSHKKEHDNFAEKISKFKDDFDNKKILLSTAITDFLKDWLVTHIQGTDKQYSDYFNQKGLQ